MSDRLAEGHRLDAPPMPESDVLERVHESARAKAVHDAEPRSVRFRSACRLGLTFAIAVALLVVGARLSSRTSRIEEPVFASQRAVAALSAPGGVLHMKAEVRSRSEVEGIEPLPWLVETLEEWADVERGLSRSEAFLSPDGARAGLSIQNGETVRSLGSVVAGDDKVRETQRYEPSSYSIRQYDLPHESVTRGIRTVERLREGLASGDAKVVDRVTEDGREHWVIEVVTRGMTNTTATANAALTTMRATMSADDYALRRIELTWTLENPKTGRIDFKRRSTCEYTTWETVSPDDLPADFFDLGQVDKAAPQGTVVLPPRE